MGREDRKSDMPIRDADLRQAAWTGRVTVGDPLWRLLTELQDRRDLDREPSRPSMTAERAREIL
jgi:hypothetical protein